MWNPLRTADGRIVDAGRPGLSDSVRTLHNSVFAHMCCRFHDRNLHTLRVVQYCNPLHNASPGIQETPHKSHARQGAGCRSLENNPSQNTTPHKPDIPKKMAGCSITIPLRNTCFERSRCNGLGEGETRNPSLCLQNTLECRISFDTQTALHCPLSLTDGSHGSYQHILSHWLDIDRCNFEGSYIPGYLHRPRPAHSSLHRHTSHNFHWPPAPDHTA